MNLTCEKPIFIIENVDIKDLRCKTNHSKKRTFLL